MEIGSLRIAGKAFLAPMSEVTSLPLRVLCKRYGAAVVYTEMVNSDAYIYESKNTLKRIRFLDEERPIGVQLMGSETAVLKKAAQKLVVEARPDVIDINFGCPAYNVIRSGSGAVLLKDLEKTAEIVSALSGFSIPLTCKMRVLPDAEESIRAARTIEKAGAKALTIHGRTAKQVYRGRSDWKLISRIKKELRIPVILNGDVVDAISAKRALDETGCDAVMVGRAAIGNPYLFRQINHYLETGETLPEQPMKDRLKDFKDIVGLCKKYDYLEIKPIKMLAQNTMHSIRGARELRAQITKADTIEKILRLVTSFSLS